MSSFDHSINLVWLSSTTPPPKWVLGYIYTCQNNLLGISEVLETSLASSQAGAWLFWDPTLGMPIIADLPYLLSEPADLWHAGLKLGLGGQPPLMDYILPTWMLNRDPDPNIKATSWRISLRACLVRGDILSKLGGPDTNFETLDGSSMELGYRYISNGVFPRHVPSLIGSKIQPPHVVIPLQDQLRFLQAGFDQRWLMWACLRSLLRGETRLAQLLRAMKTVQKLVSPRKYPPYKRPHPSTKLTAPQARVSVLIPTLRRYPYLRVLLDQLRKQTHPPFEILVIDQTPAEMRDHDLVIDFSDLPLRYFTLDQAGQCSARNFGLKQARGEFILLIDDDDEVSPDLIVQHLATLHALKINVSNGVAHEVGAGPLPGNFKWMRVSSVFPANNTMIRKSILEKPGLFDLAYDHGQRADHDLGMRLFLSGELMVLNPDIAVLHHHAPMGGLREHKARVKTYAASRQQLFNFNLPTIYDLYLAKRYFSPEQTSERIWISLLGTLSIRGSWWKRIIKVLIGFLCLPLNLWRIHQRSKIADAMLVSYPQIPPFPENQAT